MVYVTKKMVYVTKRWLDCYEIHSMSLPLYKIGIALVGVEPTEVGFRSVFHLIVIGTSAK